MTSLLPECTVRFRQCAGAPWLRRAYLGRLPTATGGTALFEALQGSSCYRPWCRRHRMPVDAPGDQRPDNECITSVERIRKGRQPETAIGVSGHYNPGMGHGNSLRDIAFIPRVREVKIKYHRGYPDEVSSSFHESSLFFGLTFNSRPLS